MGAGRDRRGLPEGIEQLGKRLARLVLQAMVLVHTGDACNTHDSSAAALGLAVVTCHPRQRRFVNEATVEGQSQ